MKQAARWGSTLSSTQHRQGFIPLLLGCLAAQDWKEQSYMQTVLQEAVPSGLSFSRNHFLKGEKRRKDKVLLMLLRNTTILEALLPTLSQLFESLLNVLSNHLILGYLQIKTNLVLKLSGT